MNKAQTLMLLGALAEVQPQSTNDIALEMWAEILDPAMTIEFALAHTARHFAKADAQPIKPGDLNAAWGEKISAEYWEQQRTAAPAIDHDGDAGFHYASDPSTPFLPQQRTSRATPEVVELFFAAWHDYKQGIGRHPNGDPFAIQDYFDQVLPLMQEASKRGRQDPVEAHCGVKGCACMHSSGCYRGWMDDEKDSQTTRACPVCRPDLAHTLDQIPAPGQRNLADQARLLNRAKSDHQQGAA